jgi:hypothetical protein
MTARATIADTGLRELEPWMNSGIQTAENLSIPNTESMADLVVAPWL